MSSEQIKVEGLGRLNRQFSALNKNMVLEVKKINFEAALAVAKAANSFVPVRTGRLARSIRARSTPRAATVTAGLSSVPYAGPIHFGWAAHNIRPNPFLYKALDARRPEVFALYERQISALVARSFPRGV